MSDSEPSARPAASRRRRTVMVTAGLCASASVMAAMLVSQDDARSGPDAADAQTTSAVAPVADVDDGPEADA
ncbi:hypothetical protein K8Z61_09970 [Nocardioides sp. TRM66260-LWL]|uniref:hypothetical protein n=1 Tax=Nocardioides sp. TRM66260-LWL TaxID=2874478 RepID=UPI001CC587BF|nr:hypothetical protein [Nocardioides sp. TRM66260-LWL]MBZ5734820.1 hypothetical protein [Nocardioides sp. TRM66260-LWL]